MSSLTYRKLIPYLIMTAVILLAFWDQMRNAFMARMSGDDRTHHYEAWAIPLIFLAAIYGGYFGAGLGAMMLSVLSLVLHDYPTPLNALKQSRSFVINIAAAVFFLSSGKVLWQPAAVMAVGALVGGWRAGSSRSSRDGSLSVSGWWLQRFTPFDKFGQGRRDDLPCRHDDEERSRRAAPPPAISVQHRSLRSRKTLPRSSWKSRGAVTMKSCMRQSAAEICK
jgi:hypothetical protein